MDANAQLSLLELLDALPDSAEEDVTDFVRKAFLARRGSFAAPPKAPKVSHITEYNKFTRDMMPVVRKDFPDTSPQELMRIVAQAWKTRKAGGLGGVAASPQSKSEQKASQST